MDLGRAIRTIMLRFGGVSEPSYRVYYSLDVEACIKYWREFYGVPTAYLNIIAGSCRYDHQLYVHFDCHGNPWGPTTDMSYGHYLPIMWPDAAWAQGKWRIHTKKRSNKPTGVMLPLHNEVDILNNCCPPDWLHEILETEGVPD